MNSEEQSGSASTFITPDHLQAASQTRSVMDTWSVLKGVVLVLQTTKTCLGCSQAAS